MKLVFGSGLLGAAFEDCEILSKDKCDITNRLDIASVLAYYKPEVVINCAGIVPKNKTPIENMLQVNSIAPRVIQEECRAAGAFFVHVSSNCVFNGDVGGYLETATPSPTDTYGMSKVLGEPCSPDLLIRTSFIGLPDFYGRGLLSWASKQTHIIGYDKVIWNGVTTQELKNKIYDLLACGITGTVHVHGFQTTKYALLKVAAKVFDWDVDIVKQSEITDDYLSENRTLNSLFGGNVTKPIEQQLEELCLPVTY